MQIQRSLHRGCQQNGFAAIVERHRRPGLHAFAARRRCVQWNHQRLRRPGRYAHRCLQMLAGAIVDLHRQRYGPWHRVLNAQAKFALR